MIRKCFLLLQTIIEDITFGLVRMYASSFLLDNIYIRFGTKLYRQIVGIPIGTNCAPLVADLFLAHIIKAFNSTSRYLDNLLNIDNP